jgi:GDP-L-fucose synthase
MKILITGANGLVGGATKKHFLENSFEVFAPSSNELNLLDRQAVFSFLRMHKFDGIIHCAARVGGVLGNKSYPFTFISENLQMQSNILDGALDSRVEKLIFVASSCVYSPDARLPLSEDSLFSGKLEETNRWYATAKLAGIMQVEAANLQFGLNWLSVLPTNIYGPNDNFALNSGHVVPSLLRKFAEAKSKNSPSVKIWGTGAPLREFIHSKDLARALFIIYKESFALAPPFVINIGSGSEVSIKELSSKIAQISRFEGDIVFDKNFPDGVKQKTLDSSLIQKIGFKTQISLEQGLTETYAWVVENLKHLRSKDMDDVQSLIGLPDDQKE